MSKSQVKESFCYSNNHIIKIWEEYLKTKDQNLKFTVQDLEHNTSKDTDTLFIDTEGNNLSLQHEIALAKYKNSEGTELSTIILSELKKDASESEKINAFLEIVKDKITDDTINVVYPCHVGSYHWNLGVIEINKINKEYYVKLHEPLGGMPDEKCNLKIAGYNYKSADSQGSKYDIVNTKQQYDLSSCGVIAAENGKAYLLPSEAENKELLKKIYKNGASKERELHLNEMKLDDKTKENFLEQQNKVGNYAVKGDDFQGNKAEVQQKLKKILALEEFTQNLENSNNINNIKQILLEKAREYRDIDNLVSSLLDENHNWQDGAIDCFNNLFGTQKSINTPKIIQSNAALQGFIEYIDPLTYLKFTNTCKYIYQNYGIQSSKVVGFNKDGKQFFQENISKNVFTAKDAAAYCLIDLLSYQLNPNSIQDRGLDFNSFNLQKLNEAKLVVLLNTPYIAREFNYKNILKITQTNQSKIIMQKIIETDYVNNKDQILSAVLQELWNQSHDNAGIILEHINNQPIMAPIMPNNEHAQSILLFNILTEKPELFQEVGNSNILQHIKDQILSAVLQELWNKSHDNAEIILEHISHQPFMAPPIIHNENVQSILLFNILTEKPELFGKVDNIPQPIKDQILPMVFQELWNKSLDNADIILEHISILDRVSNKPMIYNENVQSILLFNILTEKPELFHKVDNIPQRIKNQTLPMVFRELWKKSHDNADIILEHINNQLIKPHNEHSQSILLFNILTEKPELFHKVDNIPQRIKDQTLPMVFRELWKKSHDNADIILEHINNQPIRPHNELHYKRILENILTEKPELFHKVGNIDTKNYLLDALKNAVNLKQFNEEHLNVLSYNHHISRDDCITNINILGETTVVYENNNSDI